MRKSALVRSLVPLSLLACAFAYASPAYAADAAAAEALFNQGQKLFADGHVHEACEKFSEAYDADQTALGALISLARCHEKEGKTASAWGEYKTVETLAARGNQKEREQFAHDEAAKLEPTLHKLVLNVKFPVDGIEVTRNQTKVGPGQWGSEVPVDPGDVLIKATAPSKKDWSQTVRLAPGPGVDHFDIPKLEDAPVAAGAHGQDTVIVTSNGFGTGKIIGLVLAGAGLVAAGVGVAFQLVALSQDSDSNKVSTQLIAKEESTSPSCQASPPPNTPACTNTFTKYTDHQAAKNDQTVAIPLIASGAGLLVAGAIIFFTVGSSETTKKTEKTTWQLVPTYVPTAGGTGGLAVIGTF